MVVMPDADLDQDQAVDAAVGAGYGSAGERCMAVSVVVAVGDETADELTDRLIPRVRDLIVGPGTDENVEMGPLVTPDHFRKVKSYVDLGVAEGADLVVDGRGLSLEGYEQGAFLGGCLFDHVKPDMKIYRDEIFGPVLCLVRVDSYDEALRLVSEHEYRNGAAIFTRDEGCAQDFASRVRAGMVGINEPIPVPAAYHSFGGGKSSLYGDHYIHGPEGVRFYTRMKTITTRWPAAIRAGAQFNFRHGSEDS